MENEHEQLVSMVNQLLDERNKLSRENEYLKSKLNQSILLETIHDMKKERDLLFQLLTNLTVNQKKDETNRFVRYQVREKYKSRFSNEKKTTKIHILDNNQQHTYKIQHLLDSNPIIFNQFEQTYLNHLKQIAKFKRNHFVHMIFY